MLGKRIKEKLIITLLISMTSVSFVISGFKKMKKITLENAIEDYETFRSRTTTSNTPLTDMGGFYSAFSPLVYTFHQSASRAYKAMNQITKVSKEIDPNSISYIASLSDGNHIYVSYYHTGPSKNYYDCEHYGKDFNYTYSDATKEELYRILEQHYIGGLD